MNADLEQRLRVLEAERDELAARLARAERIHSLLVSSASWRLTQPLRTAAGAVRARRFVKNLRVLNDTLASTPLAGHYWVWSGLLLGWAREGKPLANDSDDVDFGILAEDLPRFADAVPALIEAGFVPSERFLTNDGRAVIYCFLRSGIRFEFWEMEAVGDQLRYFNFTMARPTQAPALLAAQELVPFEFIGRRWLKHADHEAELTAMYGDWRTPDPEWWYMDDAAIVERAPWTRGDQLQWSGEVTDRVVPSVA